MASITKRADGQWQAKIRRKGFPAQSRTLASKGDAEAWAREVEGQMDRGDFKTVAHLKGDTLADLLRKYRLEVTPEHKGASREATLLKGLEKAAIAQLNLDQLSIEHGRAHRNVRKRQVSPATVIKEMNRISAVINYAVSEWPEYHGLVNPMKGLKRPTGAVSRDRRLIEGVDELAWIIEATESPELKDLVFVAVRTAMRRSELVTFTPAQVDFTNRGIRFAEGKTKNGHGRSVAMSRDVEAVIARRIKRMEKQDAPVFPLKADSVTQAFGRARKRARANYVKWCGAKGLEPHPHAFMDLRLHDLRHEATSRLFEGGYLGEMEVASVTGHKDMRMLKRYTHLRTVRLAELMDKGDSDRLSRVVSAP